MSKELEALKGIKKAIAEHLHKQTGVSVEKHFEYLKNDTDISIIEQALNELERLKKFKETFDNYELAKKQDFIAYENWLECERELAELKRDVKRFMEIFYISDDSTLWDEYDELVVKLSKVGEEDV